jgi:carboxyl-terminal processing protease
MIARKLKQQGRDLRDQRSRRFLVRCIIGLAIIALSFSFRPVGSASSRSAAGRADSNLISTATPEGRLAVFDDVWQTIYDRYYDANFHGVDWWGQRALFRTQAAEAREVREFYAVLRHLLAPLRDAHTRVYAPQEKFDWQHPRFVTAGVSFREIEDRITVVAVERGSQAERAGLRAGDTIETIDGKSASQLLDQKLLDQTGSSTRQAARLFALASLTDGPVDSSVAIEWKGADNKTSKATLDRQWHERNFALHIENRRGIAIVTIDAFTPGLAREFARAINGQLRRVNHARGIVFDLRGNGGGDTEAMSEIASYLLPAGTGLGQFRDRHGNIVLKLETGPAALLTAQPIKPLEIPMVILTSERTSSAAEIFAEALRQNARATVLGSQTCGCVLAVRMRHALPDGGELEVSELDYETAQGLRLEGRGIAPDENIALMRRDVYAGRDRILESALARIKNSSR